MDDDRDGDRGEAVRLVAAPHEAAAAGAGPLVAAPALAGFAPADRELAALLPVTDINGGLTAAAASFAAVNAARPGAIAAGVLAVDPFLVLDDLAAALRAGGFARAANFPTVQLLDGEAGAGLAAVGYDLAAELRLLAALEARGFAALAYVVDDRGARAALQAGFHDLVLHPAFRGEAEAAEMLVKVRAAVPGARVARHVAG